MPAPRMPQRSPIADPGGFVTAEWQRWFQDSGVFGEGEESARIAGDQAEATARMLADATEATDRANADAALDARLDTLEALNIAARLTAAEAALAALAARIPDPLPTSAPATSGRFWRDAGAGDVVKEVP